MKTLPTTYINRDPYLHGSKADKGGCQGWRERTAQRLSIPRLAIPTLDAVAPVESLEKIRNHWTSRETKVDDVSWASFLQFLLRRFPGGMCAAYDFIDVNRSGSISVSEFQYAVVHFMEYCDNVSAKRLFYGLHLTRKDNTSPANRRGASLVPADFGISDEDYTRWRRKCYEMKKNARTSDQQCFTAR